MITLYNNCAYWIYLLALSDISDKSAYDVVPSYVFVFVRGVIVLPCCGTSLGE